MDRRAEFFANIYRTAKEYTEWGKIKNINEYLGSCIVVDVDGDGSEYRIGKRSMESFFERVLHDTDLTSDVDTEKILLYANKYNTTEEIDVELADMIIQLVCFGDINY